MRVPVSYKNLKMGGPLSNSGAHMTVQGFRRDLEQLEASVLNSRPPDQPQVIYEQPAGETFLGTALL